MVARVAFQGERGAYGEMAAIQYFPDATLVPLKSFADVFEAVERKKVTHAVIPVENSIEGSVGEVYDLLLLTKLKAIGEIYQRVHHCLIADRMAKISQIKSVYSHPQALGQCRVYLRRRKLQPVPAYDTAGAVKMIKEQKLQNAAAIASRRAAELYDMRILAEGIEDRKNNYTRFLVIAPHATRRSGKEYKTSVMFSVRHVPGALYAILGEFALHGLNLTKIESRPTKETPWEYNFYLDFEGHHEDRVVKRVLSAIKSKTSYLKVLGSYKKASF